MLQPLFELTWQAWLTIGVAGAVTVILAREKLGPDIAMFCGLCGLVVCGVLTPAEALSGFAQPTVATIGLMFIIAAAVQQTGGIAAISALVFGNTRSVAVATLRLLVPTAVMSGFVNNTAIATIAIPMARSYAERVSKSPSKFLIPLSYASMMGGTWTLIGTSPNLIVSGELERMNMRSMGMFEIGLLGIPTTVVGLAYLMLVGQRMIPDRVTWTRAAEAEAKEYLVEVEVIADSPLVGQTVSQAGMRNLPGLFLAEIRRLDDLIRPVAPQSTLRAGDHLVFSGRAGTIEELLRSFPGLRPVDDVRLDGRGLFEVVVSHRSDLVGRTVKEVGFRRRFDAAILAVHRAGTRIDAKIGEILLEPGDTLVLSASPGFEQAFGTSRDFYLVTSVSTEGRPTRYQKAPLALGIVVAMVVAKSWFAQELPMVVAAMGALVALVGTRCISARSARSAVNWPVLILVGSALGVGKAMQTTGAAEGLSELILSLAQPLGPRGVLMAVYVLAALTASFISNAAAAALVLPVALSVAAASGYDARPFAVAVAVAASAGFSTPIGSNTNLMVYGPGGYRYLDYTKVGLPLNLICLVLVMILLPLIWPF